MTIQYGLLATETTLSAFTSLTFAVMAVKSSAQSSNTNALYAAARSLVFVALSIVPFFSNAHDWLIATAVGMICVQFLDGFIGIHIKNKLKTYGPFITAIFNFVALLFFVK